MSLKANICVEMFLSCRVVRVHGLTGLPAVRTEPAMTSPQLFMLDTRMRINPYPSDHDYCPFLTFSLPYMTEISVVICQ